MTRQTKRQKNNTSSVQMKLRSIEPKTRNQEVAFDSNDTTENIMMLGLPGTR